MCRRWQQPSSWQSRFDYDVYTAADVERALSHESCSIEDFKALLSPAAAYYLEQMARKAEEITKNHFGNTVYIFTPLYIANYCQNYCIYCGFNCYNNIRRKKLTFEEIEHEMQVIAKTGMEEILMLTGESRAYSDVTYIGEAVKIARKYFKNIGIEIYPVNVDEYRYLHECGVDYVTMFQETYNTDKYETLHLMGHKRVWPYRFDAQERALMGGMRGAGFSALLGLDDFRKDALATALHVYYINRKYPHAELSLSCPRLRPIVNNDKINPKNVGEKELCQVLCFLHSRIDMARKLKCEQIHLSIPALQSLCEQERSALRKDFRELSISCHSMEDMQFSVSSGATQIVLGTIFETECKKGLKGKGVDFVREISEICPVPVYAIGGISMERLSQVMDAGAAGGCMMSGFMRL